MPIYGLHADLRMETDIVESVISVDQHASSVASALLLMKLRFTRAQVGGDAVIFIRRCGYGEYYDKRMRKVSYMKRARIGDMFPRYHVYIEQRGDEVLYDLHLDQKRPSYEGASMHAGEYEGGAVEKEAERIQKYIM